MYTHTWWAKTSAGLTIFALAAILATPAQAYYLALPQSVLDYKGLVLGEEQIAPGQPIPPDQMMPQPVQTDPNQSNPPSQPGQYQEINIDQGIRDQYQGINIDQGIRNQPMDGQNQSQMGPGDQSQQDQQRQQQDQQRQQQDQKRQLQDMKRNMKPMENNLKQFEKQMKANEKKGLALSPELQQKLADVKAKIETLKNTTSAEELQDFDMGQLNSDMQELEQARREAEEAQRRVQDMQRNMKGAEQGLNMFEKQINALAKKKVIIPQELKDNLQKIKTIIAVVKKAKTWDEMEAAGIEDLQDLMMGLDGYRQQLEMLSRWSQTEKQMNQEIKNLDAQYKKSQSIVTKLAKKSIDLSAELAAFKEAIDKVKTVRADVIAKIKSGTSEDIEAAFDLLEGEFFGQMEDIWQYQRIIATMSNLGQFQSQFKQRIRQAQTIITKLKRQKIDTAELAVALNELNIKGNEILALIKTKPVDQEATMDALQEMEALGLIFEDMASELSGDIIDMPWEQGTPQIKSPMESFSAVQKMMPQKPKEEATQSSGQTCNINGVEVPGTCESLGVAQ
ncbi:MAG: hypothetical protein Q8L21_02070 [Candidatus Komeilibacteria bacterium]|nr:hypothetical protein [Candidatus Komeilibacteria bacterium]